MCVVSGCRTRTSIFRLVPDPQEQRGIAAVLDTVEHAIEKTQAAKTNADKLRDGLLNDLLSAGIGADSKVRSIK